MHAMHLMRSHWLRKRLHPHAAFFVRKFLLGLVVMGLLLLVIILPPASDLARTRVYYYHMEEMRKKEGDKMPETLSLDAESTPYNDATCGLVETSRKEEALDLTVFIIYHRQLHERLYEGLAWSSLISPFSDHLSSLATTTTREVIKRLQADHRAYDGGGARVRRNGNRIYFLATKEPLVKSYPSQMVGGRLLREWEMPGYNSNRSFLQFYSAIMTVYRSQLFRDSPVDGASTGAAVGETGEWVAFLEYDMRIDQQLLCRIRQRILQQPAHGQARCCIFHGVSHNTMYLLNNTVGHRLMAEYNKFFQTSFSLRDVPAVSATEAFFFPSALLNRIVPFLELIAKLLVNRSAPYSGEQATSVSAGGIAGAPLDVMEAAMALGLGLERNYVHVEVPIRHLTGRELEEMDYGS